MNKLEEYLKSKGYRYTRKALLSGEQIVVYKNGHRWFDVICHRYSFGYSEGLLESMGMVEDQRDVTGFLTAQDIINRMEAEE